MEITASNDPTQTETRTDLDRQGIVPLRAANARVLIEQSIGRGLRLPFGRRTGVAAVDRLNIVAHDKFQEIVDEANRPDSMIRLEQVILEPEDHTARAKTIISAPNILVRLGVGQPPRASANGEKSAATTADELEQPASNRSVATSAPVFTTAAEQQIGKLVYDVIQGQQSLPSTAALQQPDVKARITREVEAQYIAPSQSELPGLESGAPPDISAIVDTITEHVQAMTIDIPRIVVVPSGEVATGFHDFRLDTSNVRYQPVDRDLLSQSLQTNEQIAIQVEGRVASEVRLEDYPVRRLVDFPDVSYDEQADRLYNLAGQMVSHLQSYPHEDEAENVLRYYERQLAQLIHAQMQAHRWEKAVGYDVTVSRGFTELKQSAFTANSSQPVQDFRQPPADGRSIRQIVFGGFQRCLYPVQKFDADQERKLAIILDRESKKWFKPALGQFQIYYQDGLEQREYVPDFVVETEDAIYMMEPKAGHMLQDATVLAKKEAAVAWCRHAGKHAIRHGGKPWCYVLIPHDVIAEHMSLEVLINQFGVAI